MASGIRGIAQIVAFVDDPPAAARFWGEVLEAPHGLADGGALVELPFAELYFPPDGPGAGALGRAEEPVG